METLQQLGMALGLATLAGINLYLTVFAAGLDIQQGWIFLDKQYEMLAVLGHPAIIAIAGVLYAVEFFADKVPWVDSLWDAVHTLIRPLGGAFLALQVLGTSNPVFDVVVALLAGSVTLGAHSVKAGTRLIVNGSPEPFSNVALSLTEDVGVLGGLALIYFNPVLAFVVVVLLGAAFLFFAPRIWRLLKSRLSLVYNKLNAPASDHPSHALDRTLPPAVEIALHRSGVRTGEVRWAAGCFSGKSTGLASNVRGTLVALDAEPRKLYFVASHGVPGRVKVLDLEGYKACRESKFLSENLTLYSLSRKAGFQFVFYRWQSEVVDAIVRELMNRVPAALTPEHSILAAEVGQVGQAGQECSGAAPQSPE